MKYTKHNNSSQSIETKIEARHKAREAQVVSLKFLGFSILVLFCSLAKNTMSAYVVGTIAVCTGISAALSYAYQGREIRTATDQIIACDEVFALGALLELSDIDGGTDRSIKEAIINLLPKLQFKHINLLNSDQKELLHLKLIGKDTRMVIAILAGLEQIGGRSSHSFVHKLSIGKWSAEENHEVRESAKKGLIKIQARMKHGGSPKTLLRASAAPDSELLRSSSSSSDDINSNELLRPE